MNLKRLDYFCQLVSIGNYTRAAKQIGIAQPALSIAIQKLEKELGLKLINRAEKNALLTAEGKVLYESATKLLAQVKQVELELQEMKDLSRGSIQLGVSAMMGSYYFPKVLTAFKQEYPHITINLIKVPQHWRKCYSMANLIWLWYVLIRKTPNYAMEDFLRKR